MCWCSLGFQFLLDPPKVNTQMYYSHFWPLEGSSLPLLHGHLWIGLEGCRSISGWYQQGLASAISLVTFCHTSSSSPLHLWLSSQCLFLSDSESAPNQLANSVPVPLASVSAIILVWMLFYYLCYPSISCGSLASLGFRTHPFKPLFCLPLESKALLKMSALSQVAYIQYHWFSDLDSAHIFSDFCMLTWLWN